VISASALAVNVFQHWALNDPMPVGRAIGLSAAVTTIEFERSMSTGAGGTPPNEVSHLEIVCISAIPRRLAELRRPGGLSDGADTILETSQESASR